MKLVTNPSGLLFAALGLGLCLSLAGCDAARQSAYKAQSANNVKQLAMAAIQHKQEKGVWPDRLEDLKGKPNLDFAKVMKNPVTNDDPGYEYVKPADGGSSAVILYQLRGGKRDTTLPVGYADGSVGPLKN